MRSQESQRKVYRKDGEEMRAVADEVKTKCNTCAHKKSKAKYPCNECDDKPKNKEVPDEKS